MSGPLFNKEANTDPLQTDDMWIEITRCESNTNNFTI